MSKLGEYLRNRRVRSRVQTLGSIGFTSQEAWQIAESVEWIREDAASLSDAIQAADASSIRLSVNNHLARTDLLRDFVPPRPPASK